MSERRSTSALRWACLILAVLLFLIGALFTFILFAFATEEDLVAVLFSTLLAVTCIGSGIVLIIARDQLAKLERELGLRETLVGGTLSASQPSAAPTTYEQPPQPAPIPAAVAPATPAMPAAPNAPETPTPPSRTASTESQELSGMIIRSSDVLATLKDLAHHEELAGSPTNLHHLASMLQALDLPNWVDSPVTEGGMLSRNRHYWFRLDTAPMDDVTYDRFVAVEGALNLNQDTPHLSRLPYDDPRTFEGICLLMRDMCDQQVSPSPLFGEGHREAYGDIDPKITPGEWALRSALVSDAECASTVFRVVYQIQANMDQGLVVVDIEIPRPRCFSIMCPQPTDQVRIARSYALRLAIYLTRHAFDAHESVARVIVNAHERGGACCLSLNITDQTLNQFLTIARDERLETGFPTDESIRVSFDDDGWFAPLAAGPFLAADDPEVYPIIRNTYPELISAPAPAALSRASGADIIADLGINENAGRIAAWQALDAHLGTTTEHAVQVLMRARNEAEDITVIEACNRVIQELVSGDCELEDRERLAQIFINGSTLDLAVNRANILLDEEGNPDPAAAIQVLSQALAPIDEMGAYLDDTSCVYRYFGSVAERIRHNLFIDEGGRTIRLVPDSYFNAHAQLSVALDLLDRPDEALEHAEVCLRLAPTSTYAVMRKVRILEHKSSIYEAESLIREHLRFATAPRDAAIGLYRLAYMEWKLGRENLAIACYQRAITWDTEVNASAREELDDLLGANDKLQRLDAGQAIEVLEKAGIPIGCDVHARRQLLAAAVSCIDANAFHSALPLLGTLFSMESDDVVMGVYRSLRDWS